METPNVVRISTTASYMEFWDGNGDAEKKIITTHQHVGDYPVFQAIFLIEGRKVVIETSGIPLVTTSEETLINGKERPSDVFGALLTVFGL